MKKVTLTFIVRDDIEEEVMNELSWGEMGNGAHILNLSCEQSDYNIEEYKEERS